MSPAPRGSAGGSFALELDGATVGILKGAAGGNAVADVVTEAPGKSFFSQKHLGNVSYEHIALRCGLGMDKTFFEWIADAWQGKNRPRDGAVLAIDSSGNVRQRRSFSAAVISEVTLPALDGSSKEAAFLTVKLAPERVRREKGSGKLAPTALKQKAWLASTFKLELGALDTKAVSKIEAFTVKQTVVAREVGERRVAVRQPGKVEFPNLRVTLAETGSDSWFEWFDEFVLKGQNSQDKELGGVIRFLAANLKDELAQVRLFNVGIFKLASDPTAPISVERTVADLYCERMELGVGPKP